LAAKDVVMPPVAMMADAERPMRFKPQPNPLACAPRADPVQPKDEAGISGAGEGVRIRG
jgi:hypothetical protein